ncbi:MAG: nickel-dependent lactate racemase [Verrucomicrobiae bacterium]|nr:nickel-dependent lactate racemase [Verrucomicrobiae bacterium]
MKVELAYGSGKLAIDLPEELTTVIVPARQTGLAGEHAALIHALENPIKAEPLRKLAGRSGKICVVFTDITRATPNDRLIPWLLSYLDNVPSERIILLNATGTHRPNTMAELERMLTSDVVQRYRVFNHDCRNRDELVEIGRMVDGTPALVNRYLCEADLRIITGFIEPHFFAGFSGGPKGIIPGCAGLETVMSNHSARNLCHPNATFGVTDGNPLWEEIRDLAARVGESFIVNVTLNDERQITGVFAGDMVAAHKSGTDFVRASAMQPVAEEFDIVITTNSGYPLDLNLYQGVKGMTAGARILRKGGLMILACECREGIPTNSPYHELLLRFRDTESLLAGLSVPGFCYAEQWEAYMHARAQQKGRVLLYSSMDDDVVRQAHLEPCHDIEEAVQRELERLGGRARIAVLPQGPLTIPYVTGNRG